jgi:hypothetical protein
LKIALAKLPDRRAAICDSGWSDLAGLDAAIEHRFVTGAHEAAPSRSRTLRARPDLDPRRWRGSSACGWKLDLGKQHARRTLR